MSQQSVIIPAVSGLGRDIVRELLRREPLLASVGFALLTTMVPVALFALVDTRLMNGVGVWVKPLKFLASLAVFSLTMAWFAGYVRASFRHRWPMRATAWLLVATAMFEIIYITLKAAQGEASHFNVSDRFHAAMYQAMAVGAVLLTATTLPYAYAIWRHGVDRLDPAFRLALVLGLILTFILGTVTGFTMGGRMSHFVGGITQAPGLPIVGWSTIGGDWRVAHFLALHAQQIIPVGGALIALTMPRVGRPIVALFAALYVLLTGAALMQAAFNLPLIAL